MFQEGSFWNCAVLQNRVGLVLPRSSSLPAQGSSRTLLLGAEALEVHAQGCCDCSLPSVELLSESRAPHHCGHPESLLTTALSTSAVEQGGTDLMCCAVISTRGRERSTTPHSVLYVVPEVLIWGHQIWPLTSAIAKASDSERLSWTAFLNSCWI